MNANPVVPLDAIPPIVFVDEGGGIGPLFGSLEDLIDYLEWPEQFDGEPCEAYDSRGRRVTLAAESNRGPVVVSVASDAKPEKLETLLRSVARERPMRFGLLDADVDLDRLLRAFWPHMRWGKGEYPGG